ncbi:unnamed protein product, partial [Heterotrigona itama]
VRVHRSVYRLTGWISKQSMIARLRARLIGNYRAHFRLVAGNRKREDWGARFESPQ